MLDKSSDVTRCKTFELVLASPDGAESTGMGWSFVFMIASLWQRKEDQSGFPSNSNKATSPHFQPQARLSPTPY